MKIQLALVLAICLLGSVAHAKAKPEVLAKAVEAAQICLKGLPNVKKVITALRDTGLRSEDIMGKYQAYSFDNLRLIVGVPRAGIKDWGCIIGVSKLTAAEAVDLAKIWVEGSGAKRVELSKADQEDGVAAAWKGNLSAGPVDIGVVTNVDWGIFKGTGLVLLRSSQ